MAMAAAAENAPGVTDREIKIGQTMPYTGPGAWLSSVRFGREGLHANDQRSGWHQWSQDQPDQCRRRLPAMANRERDAQADRSGSRRLYFRFDWYAHSARVAK